MSQWVSTALRLMLEGRANSKGPEALLGSAQVRALERKVEFDRIAARIGLCDRPFARRNTGPGNAACLRRCP